MTIPVALRSVHTPCSLKFIDSWPLSAAPAAKTNSPVAAKRVGANARAASKVGAWDSPASWRAWEALLFSMTAVLVLTYLAVAAAMHTGPFEVDATPSRTIVVNVAPGDTLWSLSDHYLPGVASIDQRLEQIRALNPSLDTSAPLQPGMRLCLPVGSDVVAARTTGASAGNKHHRRHHARTGRQRRSGGVSGS
ncbi:MAG: LysM peptidoglycan-binding domain-containing protein [Capsulimonadaceae bacterium]|nr:LysM peptidoglycan-binding domain-containing protein [Capsulimonadaceae bacterium]